MTPTVIAGIVVLLLIVAVAAYLLWPDASKPPKTAVDQAKDAAQRGDTAAYELSLADAIANAEQQRAAGNTDIDPGLVGIRIIDRASMAPISTKWGEFRSIDVSDPARRVDTYSNLQGMVDSAADLVASAIPHIYTAQGMNEARSLIERLGQTDLDRRDCWFSRANGCWRNWSVAEPHENDRVTQEQQRFRQMYTRLIPMMESRASDLRLPQPWGERDLADVKKALLQDPAINVDNPVDADTFTAIESAAAQYAPAPINYRAGVDPQLAARLGPILGNA